MKMDFFSDLFYLYTCILTCIYVYHMHAWCLQRLEESVRYPRTGLQGIVSHHHHLGSGIQTCILYKSRKQVPITAEPSRQPPHKNTLTSTLPRMEMKEHGLTVILRPCTQSTPVNSSTIATLLTPAEGVGPLGFRKREKDNIK